MACTKYGDGRTVAFAHQSIFKEYLVKNKDWIILLRNIIRWIAKNKIDSV